MEKHCLSIFKGDLEKGKQTLLREWKRIYGRKQQAANEGSEECGDGMDDL